MFVRCEVLVAVSTLQSSLMGHHVGPWMSTNVMEEPAASIFIVEETRDAFPEDGVADSSETLVYTYKTEQCLIPENCNLT
jgi:hypothetical protein